MTSIAEFKAWIIFMTGIGQIPSRWRCSRRFQVGSLKISSNIVLAL
jgi:hypothetical protein